LARPGSTVATCKSYSAITSAKFTCTRMPAKPLPGGVQVECAACHSTKPFALNQHENIRVHRCTCSPSAREDDWMKEVARLVEAIQIVTVDHSKFKSSFVLSDKPQ